MYGQHIIGGWLTEWIKKRGGFYIHPVVRPICSLPLDDPAKYHLVLRGDRCRVLVYAVCKTDQVFPDIAQLYDLVHETFLRTVCRSRFIIILFYKLVHLIDDGRKGLPGIFLFHEPSCEACRRGGLAVHDVYFRRGRTDGEGVIVVGLRSRHDVMGRRSTLPKNDGRHGKIALLDGVDEGLPEPEQFGFLRDAPHVDTRCIL